MRDFTIQHGTGVTLTGIVGCRWGCTKFSSCQATEEIHNRASKQLSGTGLLHHCIRTRYSKYAAETNASMQQQGSKLIHGTSGPKHAMPVWIEPVLDDVPRLVNWPARASTGADGRPSASRKENGINLQACQSSGILCGVGPPKQADSRCLLHPCHEHINTVAS